MSRFTGRGCILAGDSLHASGSTLTTLGWGIRTTEWCKVAVGAPSLLKCPCGYEIPFGRAMLRFPANVLVFGNAVFFMPV